MHTRGFSDALSFCEFSILVHEKTTSTTYTYGHGFLDELPRCVPQLVHIRKIPQKVVENQDGADQFITFDQFNWILNHILKHVNDNHRSFQQSSCRL